MSSMTSDPAIAKDAVRKQWNASAAGWNANSRIIRAWLRQATDTMLDIARIGRDSRVLDIAAGAGDQTLDIASRVGPGGHVVATDISSEILEYAKANVRNAGHSNVEFVVADGESLDLPHASFDAALCRLGLMLFPHPARALKEIYDVLRPNGIGCVLVFSAPDQNPCVTKAMSIALKHAGLPMRDPYQPGGLLSLGKPGLLETLFQQAGFLDLVTVRIDAPFRLVSVGEYLQFLRSAASPVIQILNRLDPDTRDRAWAEIEDALGVFSTSSGWEGPNELLLGAGKR